MTFLEREKEIARLREAAKETVVIFCHIDRTEANRLATGEPHSKENRLAWEARIKAGERPFGGYADDYLVTWQFADANDRRIAEEIEQAEIARQNAITDAAY